MKPNITYRLLPFALLALLTALGCDPSTTTKPDLVISDLSLNSDNRLMVSIKNEGYGPVVADTGTLAIAIDGKSIGSYALANLSDKSYKNLNGTTTIPTNFKLKGSNRRVSAFIDAGNVISETNEFQNMRCITFNPPVKNGPDFVISQLALTPANQLRIWVRNLGNVASPANLGIRIRVIVDNVTVADLTPNLPALAPNATTVIAPNPAIPVLGLKQVRALLNTNNIGDETDNTNGVMEKWIGGNPSIAGYTALLAIPKIADNIIWQDGSGIHPFPSWSPAQKTALTNAIFAIENGENPSLSAPPALLPGDDISSADAWTIFLAHIAHSLWVDVHNKVSWDLNSYSSVHLNLMLDGRKLIRYISSVNRYGFEVGNLGNLTPWNPRICFDFLSNLRMVKSTPQATLYKLTDWMRGYLIHISSSTDKLVQYGYAGPPPVDKVLYALEGKRHITAGCWGTTGLYNAMLRSVNIPVQSGTMNLGGGTHSRPIFPSLDKSMPHGDDPYSGILIPSGVPIPTANLFYSLAEMNTLFSNPAPDCVGGICNTIGDQASYNSGKNKMKLAFDLKGDGVLRKYAQHGAAYMDDYFSGPFIGGSVHLYAKPYFEPAERATMVTAIETRLTDLGGGDIDVGKQIVLDRVSRWGANH